MRYLGTLVHHKWTNGLDPKLTEFLYREENVMHLYKVEIPQQIKASLRNDFRGNFGVDAMVYIDKGDLRLRKVVEVNPRVTMGRTAIELYQKSGSKGAGFYQIVRKSKIENVVEWNEGLDSFSENVINSSKGYFSVPINDPILATEFISVWHIREDVENLLLLEV